MYTYLAARLLAPLLLLLVILIAIEEREFLRRHWLDVILLFGIALLVSLPLWIFFIQQPQFFFYRLTQITLDNTVARGEPQQDLWTNLWKTLMMFTHAGDWGWADNLPGRPVFDAVGGSGLHTGHPDRPHSLSQDTLHRVAVWPVHHGDSHYSDKLRAHLYPQHRRHHSPAQCWPAWDSLRFGGGSAIDYR